MSQPWEEPMELGCEIKNDEESFLWIKTHGVLSILVNIFFSSGFSKRDSAQVSAKILIKHPTLREIITDYAISHTLDELGKKFETGWMFPSVLEADEAFNTVIDRIRLDVHVYLVDAEILDMAINRSDDHLVYCLNSKFVESEIKGKNQPRGKREI